MRITVGSIDSVIRKCTELVINGSALRHSHLTFKQVNSLVNEVPLSFDEMVEGANNLAIGSYNGADLGIGVIGGFRVAYGDVVIWTCALYDGQKDHLGFSVRRYSCSSPDENIMTAIRKAVSHYERSLHIPRVFKQNLLATAA